ncbi:DUF2997 domain-containing protein [Fictibacillus aquaticus]|uniref:DUF2997 domain-containing protein n=1 Tax=Fictibacillus aquaticus TaxID=2021314 RepID=A0A235F8G1_9BACL|nr:DUF2997 domain-containing protein [Fictibacillus aquaticus]OYD57558.1 hypothetical protein CGZ90_12875 [Fictibacillus aquaticus]
MDQRIKIEIGPDGKIKAETLGLKGKECLEFLEKLENMLDAETVDSAFTDEYYETSQLVDKQSITQQSRRGKE